MKFEEITADDIQILVNGLSWMESEGWWDTLDEEVSQGHAVLDAICEELERVRKSA